MSILIKNMEMPTSPVLFCIHPDGKVFADLEGDWREYNAISVPPHGRLIDADALFEKIPPGDIEHDTQISRCGAISDVCTWVLSAPTIIEAEGEE